MNILLVSQCDKRALTETRRILDQFAERRGDRTWQTPITRDGLDTLRRLLRKTARKNTAVACHWIRGLDNSELLWTVGDASRFNAQGAVPTNTTRRNIVRREDENDWHTLETIRLLAAMAALWHDVGKANDVFAAKLVSTQRTARDPYRHEWVSLRLLQAFVGSAHGGQDDDWLQRLSHGDFAALDDPAAVYRDGLEAVDAPQTTRSPPSLSGMPPVARAVGWLVLTHHRLPVPLDINSLGPASASDWLSAIDADWCGAAATPGEDETQAAFEARLRGVWTFSSGLPHASDEWRQRASKVAVRLAGHRAAHGRDWLRQNAFVTHLARLALMLADHHYSSLEPGDTRRVKVASGYAAWANTDRYGKLNQRLDEHLIGVEKGAHRVVQALPQIDKDLPRLSRARSFTQRTAAKAFAWQNKAFDMTAGLATASRAQGFFGVNMASTGTGKTLANGRILYALADPVRGARFSVALGLRTLTLQTGQAFRQRLGLGDDVLGILVGGAAVRHLFEREQKKREKPEDISPPPAAARGSASADDLFSEDSYISYEAALTGGPLSDWLSRASTHGGRNRNAQKLVEAPVLVCTVDHLMPAVESTRGGHQIAPMLRLLTSDLVLDEIDDFGMEDLPALARLTYWAGLLGSRVLLSSATLPPALVQGLFAAYLAGRSCYQANRGDLAQGAPAVVCAWFDEFGCASSTHGDEPGLRLAHDGFVRTRIGKLKDQPVRRTAVIRPWDARRKSGVPPERVLVGSIVQYAHELHKNNAVADAKTGRRVSFGLVRMANIGPLWEVARSLLASGAPPGFHIHLCVYHSRHPLLARSRIESVLDAVLRRNPEAAQAVFAHTDVRQAIDLHPDKQHVFIVLATAVAEVGRDHDYDWAIVEPSSMRSIIQLAGRVRRHRPELFGEENIVLLDTNWRAENHRGNIVFTRPGFEKARRFELASHSLTDLLGDELKPLSARPRITENDPLRPQHRLSDLEHARLRALLLVRGAEGEHDIRQFWEKAAHLTAIEQKANRFRQRTELDATFALVPDGDGGLAFRREHEGQWLRADSQVTRVEVIPKPGIGLWPVMDLAGLIDELAEERSVSPESCAQQFAAVDLPMETAGGVPIQWKYAPGLGFTRAQKLPMRQ